MSETFVNKVAESGIITIDLEAYYPKEEIIALDLKDYLFMGMIIKEKEFRELVKQLDTDNYQNKIVAVYCSADAIIPMWAYMLISSTLSPAAKTLIFSRPEEAEQKLLLRNILQIDTAPYLDQRVVVKGCGEKPITEEAYLEITNKLRPVVKSLMFGEPCSTVPIYKKLKSQD
jgi:hypothetical protein